MKCFFIKAANAAFLTSENVLDLCGRFYNCDPPYNGLKAKIQNDKDGNTKGWSFLQSFGGVFFFFKKNTHVQKIFKILILKLS